MQVALRLVVPRPRSEAVTQSLTIVGGVRSSVSLRKVSCWLRRGDDFPRQGYGIVRGKQVKIYLHVNVEERVVHRV